MPIYIVQGRYTQIALNGMIAQPEDRGPEVAKLIEAAGGRMLAYYVTLGDYDFMVIAEAPDEKAVAAVVVATTTGGGVKDMRTTVAMTTAEAMEVFARAGSIRQGFRSAGG